ncbi:MAG: pentapeptide repeat-containing protein [Cyanobacteria bacterium P01_F01_bin.13]
MRLPLDMVQNFGEKSLKGVSFKGKDLTDADFSGADIRGANFSQAVLVGANFSRTISGQQQGWIIGVIAIAWLLALIAGLLMAYASGWVGAFLVAPIFDEYDQAIFFRVSSLVTFIVLAVAGWVIVRRGTGTAFSVLVTVFVLTLAFSLWMGEGEALAALIFQSVAVATILAGVSVGALAVAIALCMRRKLVLPLLATMACLAAVAGATESLRGLELELTPTIKLVVLTIGGTITLCAIGLSTYMGYQAMADRPRYRFIRTLGITFSSLGGTRFNRANLTDADFTQASLKRADFRNANLKRVCWFQSRDLNQARLAGTYLEHPHIRVLVTDQQGENQTYDRLDLSGLNLQGANLQNASLIGTNLSDSRLYGANLTGAKLAQAQLYSTDLRKACLTGAYIENWGISTDTQLTQVRCDYIYMRLPTQQDPDPCRKPDNRNETFKLSDFEDFIAPIIKTLHLYKQQNIDLRSVATTYKTIDLFHRGGLDPGAAALALQQLVDQHPEAGLEVIALEGRGQQKIRLQAKVASQANRSELSQKYFENYGQLLNLPYADLQALLAGVAEKDEQIRQLEGLLDKAIQQPRFYVETYQNQGEFVMSQSKGNINIGDVEGNVSGLAAAGENQTITGATLGEVSGTVTNFINQLPDSSTSEAPNIKELLLQLQSVIESESTLTDDDKIEAVEQVKVLAEAAQKPADGALKKAAKTAMKILQGTAAGLSETTKLVQECTTLLPAITTLLALV